MTVLPDQSDLFEILDFDWHGIQFTLPAVQHCQPFRDERVRLGIEVYRDAAIRKHGIHATGSRL